MMHIRRSPCALRVAVRLFIAWLMLKINYWHWGRRVKNESNGSWFISIFKWSMHKKTSRRAFAVIQPNMVSYSGAFYVVEQNIYFPPLFASHHINYVCIIIVQQQLSSSSFFWCTKQFTSCESLDDFQHRVAAIRSLNMAKVTTVTSGSLDADSLESASRLLDSVVAQQQECFMTNQVNCDWTCLSWCTCSCVRPL